MSASEQSVPGLSIDGNGLPDGRVGGRGRGRGRGRGSGRDNRIQGAPDPSHGWKRSSSTSSSSICMQDDLVDDVMSERAALFCRAAMQRLQVHITATQSESDRAGILILFLDDVLEKCMRWLNALVNLHSIDRAPLKMRRL